MLPFRDERCVNRQRWINIPVHRPTDVPGIRTGVPDPCPPQPGQPQRLMPSVDALRKDPEL